MKHSDKLVEIFVKCDDFYKDFGDFMDSKGLQNPIIKLTSMKCNLAPSEIMAIVIYYHLSDYKCFKYYYQECILKEGLSYFPKAISYTRFIEIKRRSIYLCICFAFYNAGEL